MGTKRGVVSSRHRGGGFISLWETTGATETIQLPIMNLYTIDWGDGNVTTTETSHVYASIGQYTISSPDLITDFAFNNSGDKNKILSVSNWGGFSLIGTAFFGCGNLDVTATDTLKISGELLLGFTFCSDLVWNSSVSDIDTSNITNMQSLFNGDGLFDQFLNWDTSLVSKMSSTFRNAHAYSHALGHWDYSSVTDINNFMQNKTDANYSSANYDALLIKWDNAVGGLVFANMVNVNIGMGTIKYTAAGATAHASLVSKGFILTDGGQV